MSHTSIKDILNLAPLTALPEIQGLVTDVFRPRQTSAGTVQDIKLRDASGAEIETSVFGHEDLSTYKGKEVFINSGNKGKIVVKHDTYFNPPKVKLTVSSTCTFQFLQVHHAQSQVQTPASAHAQPVSAPDVAGPAAKQNVYKDPKAEGQRQGMCFKLAGDFYLARASAGDGVDEKVFVSKVKALAADLIGAAKELDA